MESETKSKSLAKSIIITGFIAGFLDIATAIGMYTTKTGKSGIDVLNFVASGVFGTEAFGGGTTMAVAGLLFHFCIAYSFTISFFLLYPRMNILSKNFIVSGIIYGLIVWLVMNMIVVPLSNTPKSPFNLVGAVKGAIVLMLAIGLPISFGAKKHFSDK